MESMKNAPDESIYSILFMTKKDLELPLKGGINSVTKKVLEMPLKGSFTA